MIACGATVLAHRLEATTHFRLDVKAQLAERRSLRAIIDAVLDSLVDRHPRGLAAAA